MDCGIFIKWICRSSFIVVLKRKGLRKIRSPKSDRRGSNPRSRPWQGRALPTTPLSHKRVMGIEPTYPAWKAGVLPLNYTRTACCLCISVASTKISIYDETSFVNTILNFSIFLTVCTISGKKQGCTSFQLLQKLQKFAHNPMTNSLSLQLTIKIAYNSHYFLKLL